MNSIRVWFWFGLHSRQNQYEIIVALKYHHWFASLVSWLTRFQEWSTNVLVSIVHVWVTLHANLFFIDGLEFLSMNALVSPLQTIMHYNRLWLIESHFHGIFFHLLVINMRISYVYAVFTVFCLWVVTYSSWQWSKCNWKQKFHRKFSVDNDKT